MISATRPIQPAIEWTKKVLFAPFDIEKWFSIGFCAFLAGLSFSVPGLHVPFSGLNREFSKTSTPEQWPQAFQQQFEQANTWFHTHFVMIVTLGALALGVVLAITLLFQWLSSRGIFMFLDNVVRNEARVGSAWEDYKEKAWSLFLFRATFNLLSLPLLLGVIALCYFVALPDIRALNFGPAALLGLIMAILLIPTAIIGMATVHLLLVDFIAPIMMLRNVSVLEAWRVFWTEVMPGQAMPLTWFYAMRFLFGLVVGALGTMGCCCTLGIAMLPYVSSVIFLPIHVFFRSYALTFLGEWGARWQLIPGERALEN